MTKRLTATELAQELYQRHVQPNTGDGTDITPWDRLPEFLQQDWIRTALHVADLLHYELAEEPTDDRAPTQHERHHGRLRPERRPDPA